MKRGGASLFNRKAGPSLEPLPVPEVSTTGDIIVYQLGAGDALVKVGVCADTAAVEKMFRRECSGPAVAVRGGKALRSRGGTTEPQLRTMRRLLTTLPPEGAPAIAATVPSKPAKASVSIAEVEVEIETEDEPEEPASPAAATDASPGAPADAAPTCTAKECDNHVPKPRSDTPAEVADFCAVHRGRARNRVHHWNLSLADAAQTLRDGLTSRPELAPAPKPRGRPRKLPEAPRSSPKLPSSNDPLAIVRRYASAVNALGGLEACEQLAGLIERVGSVETLAQLVDEVSALAVA